MTIEEIEERLKGFSSEDSFKWTIISPEYFHEWTTDISWLISEVKKWKQGCKDLAEEQDRIEAEVKRLREGIERHKIEKEQTMILGSNGFLRPALDEDDEKLYKLLEEK